MASIWYIGPANERTAFGYTWSRRNGWSIPEAEFTATQRTVLDLDSGFLLGQDDTPRRMPPPSGSPEVDNQFYFYYVQIMRVLDNLAGYGLQITGYVVGYEDLPQDAEDDDMYITTEAGMLYIRTNGAWPPRENGIRLQGPVGDKGDRGDPGMKGEKGDKGDTGDIGPRGLKGETGARGVTGDTGEAGPQGLPGVQGVKGDQGERGETGPRGLQGIQGVQGEKGAKGDQGIQGTPGIKGEKGDRGEIGDPGATGADGPQGEPGERGPTGPQGEKGEQGQGIQLKGSVSTYANLPTSGNEEGDAWVVDGNGKMYIWDGTAWPIEQGGAQVQGPVGPKGEKGDRGDTGSTGANGLQGIQGVKGDKGAKGDTGAPGLDGAKGDKGDPGTPGLQGVQGEPGAKGDKGDPGDQGIQGLQGIQGIRGEKGEKGDTGETGPASAWGSIPGKPAVIAGGANVSEARNSIGAVQNVQNAAGLWVGPAASKPATGTNGVIYFTY